jgi:RHS repeat-associated protein
MAGRSRTAGAVRLLPLLLLLLALPAAVQALDFFYTTSGGAITITRYTGPGGAVTIPDTIAGLPVTRIGNYAFDSRENLTSVKMTSVTIPNTVTNIGLMAFSGCTGLTNALLGNSVTSIGNSAFSRCAGLTSITIPDSVTSIGANAFNSCTSLSNFMIPAGVTNIGGSAFQECSSLGSITVAAANSAYGSVDGVVFNKSKTMLEICPAGKAGAYTIPDSVTVLGYDAFSYCARLTSVTIPNSVVQIWQGVFSFCTSLTNVTIGTGVNYFGGATFWGCASLTEVIFKGNEPKQVLYAGRGTFEAANPNTIVYYLTGTEGWIYQDWQGRPTKSWGIMARPGSARDYPYTTFDLEEGLPKKIGLPEYRVNTASLNVVLDATLFYMRTLSSPVNLRLAYNSAPTPNGADTIGLFGKNWRFRYESTISQFGTNAQVITGGGRTYRYATTNDLSTATTGNPITLVPPVGVYDELKFYGPGQFFELREKASKVTYRYAVSGGASNTIWRMTRITDRSGNQINLAVDGATGRINSITDPTNRVVSLTYDAQNLCTGIATPDGRNVTLAYDAHKNLTGITDMAGYVGSYTYDDMGFLTQMTTAGRQNTFSYIDRPGFEAGTGDPENAGDRVVTSVTNAKGQVTRYELLANNAGVKRTDLKGGVTIFSSTEEKTAKVADPLGNISQMEYSSAKLPKSFTDSNGKITTFNYDARGNLLTTKDALTNQTTMTYDSRDNLVSRTNALGKTWNYAYDGNDRLAGVETPLTNTTYFTYLSNGRLNILRDARTNETTYQYDAYGNLTRVTDPLANSTQFAYDPSGLHCISMTDKRGKIKSMQYDRNDRLTTVGYDSVVGIPQRVNVFDAFGQTSLLNELGQVTSVTRNEFGYLTSVTDPLGNRASMEYDANNNPVSVTDPLGRITTTTYDAANRPLVITDALGKTVKREYDADGNLLSLTDNNNNKTAFKYDANNRLIETKDPLLKAVTLGRDALGRATTATNARSQVIRYTYDDDGRIAMKEYKETPGGSFAQKAAFTYDPNGNVLSRADDWGTTTFTYDPRNQTTAITYPTSKTVSITYTAAGQLASITYPNGLTVNYSYDDYNRLGIPARFRSAAGTELQGGSERPNNVTHLVMALSGTTKTIDFAYDKAGNRVNETRPNNTRMTYVYDNAQRVTNVLHKAGANTLLQCNLAYNGVGSVIQETVSGSAQIAPGLPAADTATYDSCNQVTLRNGNAYTYDADGNLTAIANGEFSASYNPENRPSQITRKQDAVTETIQYTYDASGLRVKRAVVGGVTSQFHYGPDDRLLFTTDEAGNVTASYVWNGPVLAAVLTGGSLSTDLRYLHLNRLGNVMALTDSTGAPTVKYAYQPYGFTYRETVPAGTVDTNLFTFVGGLGVQDEGGGLFYMKNRYYDANTGRFLQRDPIGFEGGFNLYAYVGNNPINFIDPAGQQGQVSGGSVSLGGTPPPYYQNPLLPKENDALLLLLTKVAQDQDRIQGKKRERELGDRISTMDMNSPEWRENYPEWEKLAVKYSPVPGEPGGFSENLDLTPRQQVEATCMTPDAIQIYPPVGSPKYEEMIELGFIDP